MRSTPVSTERIKPIGRGAKVRAAVLAATLVELAESGYAALSVDDVARRAAVLDAIEPFHLAVSSTRFDGVLRFGGVARSTATMAYT